MAWAADTPEQVAKDYLKAFEQGGMEATIKYYHPESLKRFQAMMLPAFENQTETAKIFVENTWGKSLSYEELQKMPAQEFVSKVYAGFDKLRGANNVKIVSSTYLGKVKEGDDLVHVLMRNRVQMQGAEPGHDATLEKVQVTSLKAHKDSWRLQLSQEMEGASKAFKQIFAR